MTTTTVEILHLEMWMWFKWTLIHSASTKRSENAGGAQLCRSEYHLASHWIGQLQGAHLFVKSKSLRKEETESWLEQ